MMKNIYLVGFMGTGKSTVGKMLADELPAIFKDTDKMVEEKTGKSVADIFDEYSEEEFRRLESEVLQEITEEDGLVVSTGGGIVVTGGNMELMKRTGIVITLIAGPEVIMERLQGDETVRPLMEVDEPLDEIKRLLFDRARFYINAHHVIETSDITPREAADQILEIIRNS
jgi:shikimate kinase